jgi:hypothetical protein
MRGLVLYIAHGQTDEWKISSSFFNSYPTDSILKDFDILAYVNSSDVTASQIENYLSLFPNKNKRLIYTPCNGHTIDYSLSLICNNNVYKEDTSLNRSGYLFGVSEAFSYTFDLVRHYDYVIFLNADVYMTDSKKIEDYLIDNFDNDLVHHVNTMRGDFDKGFSTDFTIYRPNKFLNGNHFSYYKDPQYINYITTQGGNIPEQMLKLILTQNDIPYKIMGPSTRNNRKPDEFGVWHCHDNEEALLFLNGGE